MIYKGPGFLAVVIFDQGGWVAKLGGWAAKLGGWVAKLGGWAAKLGCRVAKSGGWVAKLRGMGGSVGSAPAYYGSSLGSNPDISQKYKMGDINKGVATTF
jgi:hypothetical protein